MKLFSTYLDSMLQIKESLFPLSKLTIDLTIEKWTIFAYSKDILANSDLYSFLVVLGASPHFGEPSRAFW